LPDGKEVPWIETLVTTTDEEIASKLTDQKNDLQRELVL
jgi:hypothetical protein